MIDRLGHDPGRQKARCHGFVAEFGRLANPARQRHRVEIGGGDVQRQHAIVLVEQNRQSLVISRLGSLDCQVDRILKGAVGRKEFGQPFPGAGTGLGDLQAGLFRSIGRHDARPARVGHDRNPAAVERRQIEKALTEIKHLLYGLNPDGAALSEGSIIHRVRAGHRAGVGQGRPLARAATPALDNHQRFAPGALAHRLHEIASAGHAFDVQRHHLCLRIACQVAQEINLVQVGAIAIADKLCDPQTELLGPGQEHSAQRTALGNQRHAAGRRSRLERRVQLMAGVHQPGTVGAHEPDAVLLGRAQHLLLARTVAGLAKSGRHDRRRRHPGPAAILQHGRYRRRWRDDHRQVDRPANLGRRLKPRHGTQPLCPWVDRIDLLKAARHELSNQLGSEPALGGRAYHHHPARVKEGLDAHSLPPSVAGPSPAWNATSFRSAPRFHRFLTISATREASSSSPSAVRPSAAPSR